MPPQDWATLEETSRVGLPPTPPPDEDAALQDEFRFPGFAVPKQFITTSLKPFLKYLTTDDMDQVFPNDYTQPADERLHRTALRVENIIGKATTTLCSHQRLKAKNKRTWQIVIRLCVEPDITGIRARDVYEFVQIMVAARVEFLANPLCRAEEDLQAHRYRRLGEVTDRWIRVSERAQCREAPDAVRCPALGPAYHGEEPLDEGELMSTAAS